MSLGLHRAAWHRYLSHLVWIIADHIWQIFSEQMRGPSYTRCQKASGLRACRPIYGLVRGENFNVVSWQMALMRICVHMESIFAHLMTFGEAACWIVIANLILKT